MACATVTVSHSLRQAVTVTVQLALELVIMMPPLAHDATSDAYLPG